MTGCVVIDKPQNVTSNDVVVKIKKILNIKKVGHLGTLDPLATGVLPICIGKATRLFDYFLKKNKTYIAQFRFGEQTFSLDLESEVEKSCEFIPSKQQLEDAIKTKFLGEIEQVPPLFSSKKINGKKAYDLARSGQIFELKSSKIFIYDFRLLKQIDDRTYEFLITCSSGTYIRSLARDLALATNTLGTMVALRRTRCGLFDLTNALSYDNLSLSSIENNLIDLEHILSDYDRIDISNEVYKRIRDGVNMFVGDDYDFDKTYAVYIEDKVCGMGKFFDKKLKIVTYLI